MKRALLSAAMLSALLGGVSGLAVAHDASPGSLQTLSISEDVFRNWDFESQTDAEDNVDWRNASLSAHGCGTARGYFLFIGQEIIGYELGCAGRRGFLNGTSDLALPLQLFLFEPGLFLRKIPLYLLLGPFG